MKLFMLRKLKRTGLNVEELVAVYRGYIRPILEYAVPVWHSGITSEQSSKIESIQKRVCRIILGKEYEHYSEALSRMGLESLYTRRISICTKFATQAHESAKFNHWFPQSKRTHHMSLRFSRKVPDYKCRTKRFWNSPVPYFIRLLNNQ